MDIGVFKKAISTGWRPILEEGKDEYKFKTGKVTWIPHLDNCIARTDRGTLLLDKDCLEDAKEYNIKYKFWSKQNG